MRPSSSARRLLIAPIAVCALSVSLAACALIPAAPEPTSSATPSAVPSASTPSAAPTATGPSFVADGTAEDNLPLFASIVQNVANTGSVQGRDYIDALVAAGFDKSAMQVTRDLTTVGNTADAIQFSVRWGEQECLVGQVGPSTPSPAAVIMPALPGGGCLIGNTRPIDW